jgi:hypothetical protein
VSTSPPRADCAWRSRRGARRRWRLVGIDLAGRRLPADQPLPDFPPVAPVTYRVSARDDAGISPAVTADTTGASARSGVSVAYRPRLSSPVVGSPLTFGGRYSSAAR